MAGGVCIIVAVFTASSHVSQNIEAAPGPSPRLAKPASHSPEFDLLCACCAEISDNERQERIHALLQQPLDWHHLTEAAEHHGVVPRVYDHLRAESQAIPPDALAEIGALYQANLKRTLWLTRELGR